MKHHNHLVNELMGLRPVLFQLGPVQVSSYTFFVALAFAVAILVYYFEARKVKLANEYSFLIAVGAFAGSTIGAKLLELVINLDYLSSGNDFKMFLFSGRTIIGGLIGGTLGVWLTKRIVGIKSKRGNLFAPAIAIGVAIGRIGCLFNGCCYGKESALPWAINLGDGIKRHPTMIYESLFMLLMFVLIKLYSAKRHVHPGFLFKILMLAYFCFRFSVEFIRVEKQAIYGFSYFQIISVFVITYLMYSNRQLFMNQIFNYGESTTK